MPNQNNDTAQENANPDTDDAHKKNDAVNDAENKGKEVNTDKGNSANPDNTDKKSDAKPDNKSEDASLLAEVMDKKEKLRKSQAEKEELAAKLKEYGDIDPKKVQELIKREQDAVQRQVEERGEYEQAKKMMAEAHQTQVKALNDKIAALNDQLAERNQVIDGLTLGNNFANSAFIKDNLILTPSKARALYGSYFEVKDGKVIPYNKPAGSTDRAPLVNANGDVYDFDTAFAKIIESDPDRDTLLRSKVKEGAASRTDNVSGKKQPTDSGLFGAKRILAGLNAEKQA